MPATKETDIEDPIELPDGRLICATHGLTICGKCCVDYSFMDEILAEENEDAESDGDELLTEEEQAAFKAKLIVKKGCDCLLPLSGSGCKNCDPELKTEAEKGASKSGKVEKTNSKQSGC